MESLKEEDEIAMNVDAIKSLIMESDRDVRPKGAPRTALAEGEGVVASSTLYRLFCPVVSCHVTL